MTEAAADSIRRREEFANIPVETKEFVEALVEGICGPVRTYVDKRFADIERELEIAADVVTRELGVTNSPPLRKVG